jgi:CelD/BcsL family acetyltransferase involved in cellulose biosynthesis
MGVGFELNDENRRRMELAANKGWLRTYMLYVEGKPCVYYMGTHYRDWLYLDYTSYAPAFHREEPGNVLYARMVEELCAEKVPGLKGLDYGPGDSVFKQRFGDVEGREVSLYLFAPTGPGYRAWAVRAVAGFADRVARRVSQRLKVEGRVKTWWRTRFRKQAQQESESAHDIDG